MKKLAFICLFASLYAHADFAQIHDTDGYTNLREKPNANSRIIQKIPTGTYVYTPESDANDFKQNGWVITYDIRHARAVEGWVHQSRLMPLATWERIAVKNTADGFSCLKNGTGVQFSFEKFNFKLNQHDFTQDKDGYLTHYRGKKMFGTDGQQPETHIREIRFTRHGKTWLAPPAQYEFLFNPYFHDIVDENITSLTRCHYRAQDDTFFVSTVMGDGAAYSEVLFVFEHGNLKTVLPSLHPEV